MRQCVGCRELKPKKDMIRVIKTAAEDEASSQIVLDATGRKNGRGAYVFPNSECLLDKKQGSGTIIKNANSKGSL
mgnify:CR=1 FL=1